MSAELGLTKQENGDGSGRHDDERLSNDRHDEEREKVEDSGVGIGIGGGGELVDEQGERREESVDGRRDDDVDEIHFRQDPKVHEDDDSDADADERPTTAAATVVRKPSRIDLDAKLEPQPWDLVEPPASNNGGTPATNGEYYASLTGRKYNTLSSARARTLIPKSSYYFGPPPPDSAYGTAPTGQIGVHHPREVLRVERDYTGGELIQFAPIYPLELEGRITPTQFLESINEINEVLISAHSLRWSFLDNFLAVFSLQLSRLVVASHYDKEMRRLEALIRDLNVEVYNPVGLNILWPRRVAFLFMEIEYY